MWLRNLFNMIDPSWNEPVVLPFPVRRSVFAVVFGPLVIDPVWNTGAAGSLAGHPAAKEVQLVLRHITEGLSDSFQKIISSLIVSQPVYSADVEVRR